MSKGVLLVNLGSPDSPSVMDVRRYLREFLMDGRVLDVPWLTRFFVVYFAILPRRPKQTGHAYQSIWTREGSPLIVTTRNVQKKLQQRFQAPIELAMRYQNPSIERALTLLAQQGINELFVIPLFPHYAMSSYESAVERVKQLALRSVPGMKLQFQPPFYDDPDYIVAMAANAETYLRKGFDHLLFSFHGVPERQIRKSDPTGCHCLAAADCCQIPNPAHATCYRAQSLKTMAALVNTLRLPTDKFSFAFQSRLGRHPWLRPYTDIELTRFAAAGKKRMLVICPSFVSDCLETLEEIQIRGRESFIAAGGTELTLIPCLNEHPLWIDALGKWIGNFLGSAQSSVPKTQNQPSKNQIPA